MDLRRITIEGREGTVAYFDADGEMCEPEQAVSAKVVYDDGERAFFRIGPATSNRRV
jgi:hypothetical protein